MQMTMDEAIAWTDEIDEIDEIDPEQTFLQDFNRNSAAVMRAAEEAERESARAREAERGAGAAGRGGHRRKRPLQRLLKAVKLPTANRGGDAWAEHARAYFRKHRRWPIGENVEYYSDTYSEWIPAMVAHVHEDGSVALDIKEVHEDGSVTMDIKENEDPSNMRIPDIATSSMSGENVEYYSAKFGMWIPAIVEGEHADGSVAMVVNLRAQPALVRIPDEQAHAGA